MRHAHVAGAVLVALATATLAGAQPETPAQATDAPGLTGTWVMLIAGHQVGLEVEEKADRLEGTLFIMGQRVPVDGARENDRFTLASDDDPAHGGTVKITLSGTHKPDDTLEGSIDLPHGPMAWTAERLKKP